MDIINLAVAKVCGSDKFLDPHSKEFMLASFKETPPPEDLDPWRTTQDIIDDAMMRYTSLYKSIYDKLKKEYDDGTLSN